MEHDVSHLRYYTHILADVVIVSIAALVAMALFLPVTVVAVAARKGSNRWIHQRSKEGAAEVVR